MLDLMLDAGYVSIICHISLFAQNETLKYQRLPYEWHWVMKPHT